MCEQTMTRPWKRSTLFKKLNSCSQRTRGVYVYLCVCMYVHASRFVTARIPTRLRAIVWCISACTPLECDIEEGAFLCTYICVISDITLVLPRCHMPCLCHCATADSEAASDNTLQVKLPRWKASPLMTGNGPSMSVLPILDDCAPFRVNEHLEHRHTCIHHMRTPAYAQALPQNTHSSLEARYPRIERCVLAVGHRVAFPPLFRWK